MPTRGPGPCPWCCSRPARARSPGWRGWRRGPTTIWSSRSAPASCWPGWAPTLRWPASAARRTGTSRGSSKASPKPSSSLTPAGASPTSTRWRAGDFRAGGLRPRRGRRQALLAGPVPPGQGQRGAPQMFRAMNEHVPVTFETYYAPWDAWYRGRIDPMPDGGLAGYFQDVTESKRADEALRRSEERSPVLRAGPDRQCHHHGGQGVSGSQRRTVPAPRSQSGGVARDVVETAHPPGRPGRNEGPLGRRLVRGNGRVHGGEAVGTPGRTGHRHHGFGQAGATRGRLGRLRAGAVQDVTDASVPSKPCGRAGRC